MKKLLLALILSVLSVLPWAVYWGTWNLFRPFMGGGGPQIFWKVQRVVAHGWSGHCFYFGSGATSLAGTALAIYCLWKKRRPYWMGGVAIAFGALGGFCFWSQIVDFLHSI